MVPELGHVSYESESSAFWVGPSVPIKARDYSDDTAREIDKAVRSMVQEAFHDALGILREHRAVLDEGATTLLAQETLGESELRALYDKATSCESAAAPAEAETGSE